MTLYRFLILAALLLLNHLEVYSLQLRVSETQADPRLSSADEAIADARSFVRPPLTEVNGIH